MAKGGRGSGLGVVMGCSNDSDGEAAIKGQPDWRLTGNFGLGDQEQ